MFSKFSGNLEKGKRVLCTATWIKGLFSDWKSRLWCVQQCLILFPGCTARLHFSAFLKANMAKRLRFGQWRHRQSGDVTSRQVSHIPSTGHHFNPELRKRHSIWEKLEGHLWRTTQSWNGEGLGPGITPEGRVPIRDNLCKLIEARTMPAMIRHQEL